MRARMPGSEFDFRADDGQTLLARRWLPEGRPRAIVQIAHGLAEHSARYARLAAALNSAGYAVYANDHRGHGPKAAAADLGHFADQGGWDKVVGDLWTLNRRIAAEQPGARIVFLGHSLGSFLGRGFIAQHSDALAGVALSGSNGKPPAIATLGRLISREERPRLGKRGKSDPSCRCGSASSTNRSSRRAPPSTGFRATRRRSTPSSPIRSAAFRSRPSSRSTSSTPFPASPAGKASPRSVKTCRSPSSPASATRSAPTRSEEH